MDDQKYSREVLDTVQLSVIAQQTLLLRNLNVDIPLSQLEVIQHSIRHTAMQMKKIASRC